jgi:hypothetical protein
LSAASLLKYCYLAYLSRPSHERSLYRAIRRQGVHSIVELGIGEGTRTTRLIEVASRYLKDGCVRYTGIDLFEARPGSAPGMTLKRAHRMLSQLGAKVQLVPGDPYSALARTANSLTGTDLIVIGGDQDAESLAQAWFYVPRMLHEGSRVFVAEPSSPGAAPEFRQLDQVTIARLAKQAGARGRRVA